MANENGPLVMPSSSAPPSMNTDLHDKVSHWNKQAKRDFALDRIRMKMSNRGCNPLKPSQIKPLDFFTRFSEEERDEYGHGLQLRLLREREAENGTETVVQPSVDTPQQQQATPAAILNRSNRTSSIDANIQRMSLIEEENVSVFNIQKKLCFSE